MKKQRIVKFRWNFQVALSVYKPDFLAHALGHNFARERNSLGMDVASGIERNIAAANVNRR